MDKNLIRIADKKLLIADKSISFIGKIADVAVLDDEVVVMLDVPTEVNLKENIYAVSKDCEILWQIQPIEEFKSDLSEILPYENLFYNNQKLSASDFYGRKFDINAKTGKIENFKIAK